MKRFLLVVLAVFIVDSPAAAQTINNNDPQNERDRQELIRLENETVTATERRDFALLDRLVANDFINTTSKGVLRNKAETIASWTNNAPKNTAGQHTTISVVTTLNEMQVRVSGKTAIVTGLDRATYKNKDGSESKTEARFTNIWEKRKIGWQLIAGHVSRIPPPNNSPAPDAQTNLEQELKQLIREMEDGRMSRDKSVAERTLADGYISTHENGSNGGGKAQAIKGRSDAEANKRLADSLTGTQFAQNVEDLRVEPHGDTTAVNYRLVYRLVLNGESVVKQFRCNEVFIKRDGRWQSVLHTETVIPGEPVAAKIDTKVYGDYIGEYRLHSKRNYTITREGDKLFIQAPGVQKTELVPEDENTYVQKSGLYYRIIFVRNDKGQVAHLRLREFPGVEYSAIRIK